METPLLSAVLIVKDEEENLPGCLESLARLKPLLSDVVVYDTGSTDATIAVAEHYGAVVVRGYWDDDFARARNDATTHARSKWVLSIDADERVVADVRGLRDLLRRGLTAGLTGWDVIDVMILDVDAHDAPLARHPFNKLFRPGRAQWESPLHEVLVATRERHSVVVERAAENVVHLRHHGYAEAERRHQKAARNAGVADEGLSKADTSGLPPERRAKLLADQGRSLAAAGGLDAAESSYRAALAVKGVHDAMRVVVLQDAVSFFTMRRHFREAEALIEEIRIRGGDSDVVAWLWANLLIDSGRARDALPILRSLRAVRLSSTLELDGSIAVATLLRAAVEAGEFDEALACAIQLVGSTGDVQRYGPQLLRLWGGQPPEVLADLLDDVVGARRAAVAEGLDSLQEPGPAVARALRRDVVRRSARSGTAFGA